MVKFQEEKQKKKVGELHRKEEEELAQILSKKYQVNYADLSKLAINTDALRLIKEDTARNAKAAAFHKVGKKISIAVKSPNTNKVKILVKELESRGYKTNLFMVSKQSLERAWDRYKDLSFAVETKAGVLDISGEDIKEILEGLKTLDDSRKLIDKVLKMKRVHRTSRILETIIAGALSSLASDIHIEPEENYVRLRYRIDGVLTDILTFGRDTYKLLLSRIKLLSGLVINVRDKAQDGRFSVQINERDVEMRTSILPGAYGESIVLRILHPETIAMPIGELGIEPDLLAILEEEIRKPNGMILTTGPTGSGKTTTLYAFLKKIHKPEVKIITIEDPVEYHLPGIVQTQTNRKEYTFFKGLRSALRQDPDVVMIGEIRDEEVAETAINAALTGHLVFSTLHTNNAAGAFPRLIDLGVNPKVISSSINIVMAQRLVRKLKEGCKKEVTLEGKRKEFVDRVLNSIDDKSKIPENTTTVFEAIESKECNDTGYQGRIGVFEAIKMDSEVEELVKAGAGERAIADGVRKQGILTMVQDGVLKALRGITSLEEIERVIEAVPASEKKEIL